VSRQRDGMLPCPHGGKVETIDAITADGEFEGFEQ
jgi:hypothetical protein